MMAMGTQTHSNEMREVERSLKKLVDWLQENGQKGYDPYDVRGCPLFLHPPFIQKPFVDLLNRGIKYSDIFFPIFLRRILRIKKERNSKAVGLFTKSYLDLYRITKECKYLEEVRESLSWLERNATRGYKGLCWGYPFDWQWLHFIPKGTPSGVVTSVVGKAFFDYYLFTHDKKYIDYCRSICNFFLHDLNIDIIASDKICFSYTPLDRAYVLNANLFVAEFLIRIGRATKNQIYIKYGHKALNYILSEQNDDGSFYYYGRKNQTLYQLPEDVLKRIDNYHTGFILRNLYSIYCMTYDDRLFLSIKQCLHHYLKNLFEDKTIPKIMPEYIYPVNIHSCAEAILCLSTLLEDFSEGAETLKNVTLWTINEMQTSKGWFIYMIKEKMGLKWKIKIPFIRWGQAWMLRALSNYYFVIRRIDHTFKFSLE